MNWKTTVRLFAAVCAAVAAVWLCERLSERTGTTVMPGGLLFPDGLDDVAGITVRNDGFEARCSFSESVWHIVRPIRALAASGRIERILDVMRIMRRTEIVTAADRAERELTLEDYGLAEPRAAIAFETGTVKRELLIGADSPLGNELYVRLDGSDDVIAVSREIAEVLPGSVKELRDRGLIHGESARTWKVGIQMRAGRLIRLVRTSDGKRWVFQQPEIGRANARAVEAMLDSLYSAEVEDFVWDETLADAGDGRQPAENTASQPRYEMYHLAEDEALVRVAIWREGDDVGTELFFGRTALAEGEKVYARQRGVNSVWAVKPGLLEELSVDMVALRDRNVFSMSPSEVSAVSVRKGEQELHLTMEPGRGWRMTKPLDWKADGDSVRRMADDLCRLTITAFADGSETNLVSMGLEPAQCSIHMSSGPVEEYGRENGAVPEAGIEAKREGLIVGVPAPHGTNVYCRFAGRPVKFGDEATVFLLPARVAEYGAQAADPLAYRDRTVLAVARENVRRITVSKCGVEQIVERDKSGTWRPAGSNESVEPGAVEGILSAVSNLRTARIECHAPGSYAAYGLEHPDLMLTLRVDGDEGIQKSVLIGYRAGTGGVYAMVKGTDVVFVLETGMVDTLVRDLLKVPAER